MPPQQALCPRCRNLTSLDPANSWRPFCSERCKMIDLGEWFAERRVITAEPQADDLPDEGDLH